MSGGAFVRRITVALICSMMPVATAWSQSAGSTIQGTVKDESGAAVPGVAVTVAAAELQVGKISTPTDAEGKYRIGDLPAGTYNITFELQGFKTVILNDFRLAIGFVARADATMAVGGIEESVTVSGASPVVDLTSTTTSTNLTRETIDVVPIAQGLTNLYAITAGVTTSQVDVGGSMTGKRIASQNYGPGMNSTIRIEGIDIADGTDTGVYSSSFYLDEMQIRTSGNDAEVSPPGTAMVGVMKSGSNQLHGSYNWSAERPELQSNNLNGALQAQGLTNTNPIVYLYDGMADLGGRILKDKLWFYIGGSKVDRVAGVPGFASGPGPDGKYMTADDPLANVEAHMKFFAVKLSYQPTPNNRVIYVWQPNDKYQPQGLPPEPSRFVPLESTLDYHNPSSFSKGELQSTISNHMVMNLVGGYSGFLGDYLPTRSRFAKPCAKGNPSTLDRETSLKLGCNPRWDIQHNNHWHFDGGLSMLPEKFLGGHHELKTGTSINWHQPRNAMPRSSPAGNYVLVFDRIGGLSHQPAEIQIRNAPVFPDQRTMTYAGYLKDTWRLTNRLTLNLGVRYEYQHAYTPRQSKDASPDFPTLFPAVTYAPFDVLTWRTTVPRIGLAWNIAERTVVKASAGRFNNGTPNATPFNPMSVVTETFRWKDLDGNGDYTPGEVNLDPNGPDFLSITGVNSTVLNKDLQPPMTNELTVGVERELRQNLGVRALYVYKKVVDQFATTNVLLPRSAYNIPLTRRDPGPDGVLDTKDDGRQVTIYDYDPAYRGAAFVRTEQRNSDRDDSYQTIEFTMTKRSSGRWSTTASFWVVKNNAWLIRIPDNPNNDVNAKDETWRWAGNLTGEYQLPWGVQFSGYLTAKTGLRSQRTNIFRAVDPDGGPRLNQLSTVTLALDTYGSQKGTAIDIVNLRAAKSFFLGKGQRIEFDADLFNLLNTNAPLVLTFASGPTFGYATDVVPARIARLGIRYTF
jgi:Carboxypeptidase regulatory-like domain/TonB dependent receptor-like, beta-barrel